MLPRTRTIVVTAEDPVAARPAALEAGAFAFVDKLAMNTDLLPAVRLACHELAREVAAPGTAFTSRWSSA